jgi:TP901 family phage tail tape measure protein
MGEESIIELLLKLKDAMTPGVKKAEAELTKFDKALEKFEKTARHFKAVWYAGLAFEGIAWSIGESLKELAEPALEFEDAQQSLARATGKTVEQLDDFKEEALSLSEKLPQSAEAITNAQAELVRMLGSTQKALDTTAITTQFATATGMDMTSSAQLLASAYENLGNKSLPVKQGFQQIADLLTTLQNRFSTGKDNGDMLVRSFARLAGATQQMGVDTVQAAAALGVLNESGFGGGRGSGMYLEELLDQLGKLDKDGIPAIQKYGIALAGTTDQAGRFHMDLMGTLHNMLSVNPARLEAYIRGLGSEGDLLQILLNRYQDIDAAVKVLDQSQGATASLAAEMNKGWSQQLTDLHHTYQNLEMSLGEVLVPMLIEIGQILQPVIDGFRKFVEAHRWVAGVGLALMMVLGVGLLLGGSILVLTATFGALKDAIWVVVAACEDFSLVTAFLNFLWGVFDALVISNPWGLLAAGLIFAAHEILVHWQAVKDFFTTGWGRFTGIGMIVALIEGLLKLAPSIEAFGRHFIDWIVTGIHNGMGELERALHDVWATMKRFMHLGGSDSAAQASISKAVSHTVRAAPIAAAAMAGFSFSTAPAVASGVNGGVHFHVHMEGGGGGDTQAQADSMLTALRTRQSEFVDVFKQINDRAQGDANRTDF